MQRSLISNTANCWQARLHEQLKYWSDGQFGTCLSGGGRGGGGPGGRAPPPLLGTILVHREQKIYWATNHSAHGNVILLVANKANSSLQVNSGFPHLIKTQQIQQSGTFTISCQLIVIMVNQN